MENDISTREELLSVMNEFSAKVGDPKMAGQLIFDAVLQLANKHGLSVQETSVGLAHNPKQLIQLLTAAIAAL